MKKKGILLAFILLSELQIHAQDKLLNMHRECEQRIEAHYPDLAKKNPDGSYSFTVSSSNTIIGPFANYSYESTAAFDEPGNLSRPLCEKTITISRSKITVKWHDAVMLSPETSNEPRWSADHSTYGYISMKPQDPYKELLGCKGGSRQIKNGGILVDIPDKNQISTIYRIEGSGNAVCKHSSRRIPIHVTSRDPFTGLSVGGSPGAAADGLSPYRFDHNQTITYTWDEIVSKNKFKSKEVLIRVLLENRVDGICVGDDNEKLSFGFKESDYINRILWKLFDYSEEKLKNEIAMAEKARREEIERQEAHEKAEKERQRKQMQADCQEAESAWNKGEQLLNSNLQEAYQSYQTAIDKSTNAFGIATSFLDSLMQYKTYEIWTLATARSVQCSYQLSLIDPQFIEIFQKKYAEVSQTLEKKNYAKLVSNIGVKAFLAEKYDDALAYLDKAIDLYRALDIKNCIPAATKAYCLSCMGKVDESYSEIESVLVTSPDEIYPNEIKGRILIKNGNKKQAKKWWEKTVLPMFHEKAYETRFYKMLKEEGIIK